LDGKRNRRFHQFARRIFESFLHKRTSTRTCDAGAGDSAATADLTFDPQAGKPVLKFERLGMAACLDIAFRAYQ